MMMIEWTLLIKIKLWNLFKSLTWYQLSSVYQWIAPESIDQFIIDPYIKPIGTDGQFNFPWLSVNRKTVKNETIRTTSYKLHQSIACLIVFFFCWFSPFYYYSSGCSWLSYPVLTFSFHAIVNIIFCHSQKYR